MLASAEGVLLVDEIPSHDLVSKAKRVIHNRVEQIPPDLAKAPWKVMVESSRCDWIWLQLEPKRPRIIYLYIHIILESRPHTKGVDIYGGEKSCQGEWITVE